MWIERLCLDALKRESDAWPKPGLVTPVDSGSHRDMNHATFIDSIAALQGYFAEIAEAAACECALTELQQIGIRAEAKMQQATRGRNTHRGAIFNLGLLAAGAALRQAKQSLSALTCGQIVAQYWGKAILASRQNAAASHGTLMSQRYTIGGARVQAASGFPAVYAVGLPVLNTLMIHGVDEDTALIGALMTLMAKLDDTNLLWRGGEAGLRDVQAAAETFNGNGGVLQTNWRKYLIEMHTWMVARNLSPGGSADLVAATWLARKLDGALETTA